MHDLLARYRKYSLLAVVLLHEQLTLFTITGGLLIIASVYLLTRQH